MLIVLGIPPLGVYNQNTEGENCKFQARPKNISQTVSNTVKFTIYSRLLSVIGDRTSLICCRFFTMGQIKIIALLTYN